jgi:competence protein ComEC
VVRITARAASALLTGDIEARSEAEIVGRGEDLATDVLLVPHHGSRSSSTPAFIDAAMPSLAIVSAAHRSRFGHPHEAVVRRYAERGIEMRRTDREGALRIELPADALAPLRVRGHAPARVRYWSERRAFP